MPPLAILVVVVFFGLTLPTIGLLFEVTLPGASRDRVGQHGAHDATIRDLFDQRVGHHVTRQNLRMLNEIETGFNRQPETFWARGVGLGNQPTLVCLLHDHLLCQRREPDHDRGREVAGAAVLDEIGPEIQIFVDGNPQFFGLHLHPLFAAALRDEVVEFFLEQGEPCLTPHGEAD